MSAWTPRTAGLPWGLVGMLALVWGIEGQVDRRIGPLYSLLSSDWAATAKAAVSEAPGCEVLAFGDSQIKLGLQARRLEERLGVRAYNLAVNRGLPSSSEILLRRALAAGARPKAVILGASPGLLAASPNLNGPLWPELAEPSEILDLSWLARDPRPALQALAAQALPSLNARDELRASTLAAFRDEESPSFANTRRFLRNWRDNRGSQAHPGNPRFVDRPGPGPDETGDLSDSWRCRPENLAHLRRFLRICEAEGLRVFWLAPGFSPATRERREGNGLDDAYTRFVRGLQAEFPDMVVLDGRRLEHDASLYIDPIHLDRDGADRLSAVVARAIGPMLADSPERHEPAWIDLEAVALADDSAPNRGTDTMVEVK